MDDALDVFGCHGIGGIFGALTTGLFAQKALNPAIQWNGLVFGETELMLRQLLGRRRYRCILGCRGVCCHHVRQTCHRAP